MHYILLPLFLMYPPMIIAFIMTQQHYSDYGRWTRPRQPYEDYGRWIQPRQPYEDYGRWIQPINHTANGTTNG